MNRLTFWRLGAVLLTLSFLVSFDFCLAEGAAKSESVSAVTAAASTNGSVLITVAEPGSPADVAAFLPALIQAAKQGNWLLVGAIVALILTFLTRKLLLPKLKLGHGALPLISAVIGVVAGVGIAIVGGANLNEASFAVLSGPLASTLWDAAVKYFFKKD